MMKGAPSRKPEANMVFWRGGAAGLVIGLSLPLGAGMRSWVLACGARQCNCVVGPVPVGLADLLGELLGGLKRAERVV